jgi:hypothetical protein
MPVFNKLIKKPRKGKGFRARRAPRGSPMTVAITRAKPDTCRERRIILRSSGFRWVISRKALTKP